MLPEFCLDVTDVTYPYAAEYCQHDVVDFREPSMLCCLISFCPNKRVLVVESSARTRPKLMFDMSEHLNSTGSTIL